MSYDRLNIGNFHDITLHGALRYNTHWDGTQWLNNGGDWGWVLDTTGNETNSATLYVSKSDAVNAEMNSMVQFGDNYTTVRGTLALPSLSAGVPTDRLLVMNGSDQVKTGPLSPAAAGVGDEHYVYVDDQGDFVQGALVV